MLLVMSFHARGSQSIFQVFVTDFTKATAWKVAQNHPNPPSSIWKHTIGIYRGLPNSNFPNKQRLVHEALSVFALPLLWPLQWQFLSDQCWLPGKGHPKMGQGAAGRGAERARGRLANLVKRKEHPWGIFECEGWTETTIACEEFYFAQPLKLWNSSQHKKWKKPTRELTARFWAALSHLEFLLRLNYTPAWITLLLIIKAFHSNTLFTQITKRVTTTSICKLVLNWNIS